MQSFTSFTRIVVFGTLLSLLKCGYTFGLSLSTSAGLASIVLSPDVHTAEVELKAGGKLTIEIRNMSSPAIQFGVIQVHSYFVPVTISYNETLLDGFYTTGTNTGLVVFKSTKQGSSTSVYLTNNNAANNTAQVLLILQIYDNNAPIPGGCNMEESIQTAPFLPTTYTNSVLTVEFPLASWPLSVRPATCDRTPKQYDIYQYYLPETERSMRKIFDSILMMSSVNGAEENGRKVEFYGSPPSKIRLANYKGTGRVVVVVARALTSSAAYVPVVSFGCDVMSAKGNEESCEILYSLWTKLLISGLLFLGLFHTLMGHRFFKTHLFLHGFATFSIVSYVLVTVLLQIDSEVAKWAAFGMGVLGGLLLIMIWCQCDVPLLAVFIGCLLVGFLFSSIIAFTPLADYWIFKNDLEYWLTFSCIVLVVPVVLISFTHTASIICTALVGSFLSIIVLDMFVGSNLKFVIFNVFHRATTDEFETAIVDPPFQMAEALLVAIWFGMSLTGITFQLWREQGRPPFPPAPTWFISARRPVIIFPDANSNVAIPSEVTHLLYERNVSRIHT